MLNILLAADNRLFIRRIFSMLTDFEQYNVNVSFSSSGVFEAYLRYRSEVVILDSANYLPAAAVKKQFERYHWNPGFLVVNSSGDPQMDDSGILYADMDSGSLQRALALFTPEIPSPSQALSRSLGPDTYSLMLSVRTENRGQPVDPAVFRQLRQQLESAGVSEMLEDSEKDILVLTRKNNAHVRGAFEEQVHTIICKTAHPQYVSLYRKNLRAEELEGAYHELLDAAKLCCCVERSCLNLNGLRTEHTPVSAAGIYTIAVDCLEALLRLEPERGMINLVANMKHCSDFDGYTSLRRWLVWMEAAVLVGGDAGERDRLIWQPIDHWYRDHLAHWDQIRASYAQKPLAPVVRDALLLVLRGYAAPSLSLETVAERLSFSKAYVSRVFREQIGCTLVLFLQKLRVEHACRLLTETGLPVKAVAQAVGYSDAQYFSKLFCRVAGHYPTEYRAQHTKEDLYAGTCPKPEFTA